jgi:hypothetical protein
MNPATQSRALRWAVGDRLPGWACKIRTGEFGVHGKPLAGRGAAAWSPTSPARWSTLGITSTAAPCGSCRQIVGRLMLTVLGGLAEFERELIRARTDDGRTRAKARGVKFGHPVKLTAHQRKEAIQRLAEGAVQADLVPMA